jgi:endogenous inhibitor of DNA gyrase (YacG/DUF329 family)
MIDTAVICKACGRPIAPTRTPRQREYCNQACKQRDYRRRKTEEASASDQDILARIAELEAENARLREQLNVEARYRMDTEARHFKPWLRKQRLYTPGSFAQRFVDNKVLPPQASRAHYEALLRSARYSDEEIETFRDLWKAMLLS